VGGSQAIRKGADPACSSDGLEADKLGVDSVKQEVRCNDNHLGRFVGMIVVG